MDRTEKELGGYLEMELFHGEEYYPALYRLNLGRTSLVWLLSLITHDRIFIPEYICDTVIESVRNAGYSYSLYKLDKDLQPVWGEGGAPGENDIFYLVNFFGQLTDEEIIHYRDTYPKMIVDNAHAFYDRPVPGTNTLYSPRKFFGIPDGAYVATDVPAPYDDLEPDFSSGRVRYIVGRLEESANKFYPLSKEGEAAFSRETPKKMSLFTQNVLRAVDYEDIRNRRCHNYQILKELLPASNPFNRKNPTCPYLFPYYHEDGMNLRRYLIEHKIYIPVLWAWLIDDEHRGSLEYDWSKNILCLPVDQRYGEEDMRLIAEAIREYEG